MNDILSNLEASVELDIADQGQEQVLSEINEQLQEGVEAPTQLLAAIPDAAIGAKMAGATANALTPKLEQEAMKRGATKLAPFLAKHVAPRLLGGAALSGGGPFGFGLGLVAPEAGMQVFDAIQKMPSLVGSGNEQMPYEPRLDALARINPQMHPGQLLTEAAKGPVMPTQNVANFLKY